MTTDTLLPSEWSRPSAASKNHWFPENMMLSLCHRRRRNNTSIEEQEDYERKSRSLIRFDQYCDECQRRLDRKSQKHNVERVTIVTGASNEERLRSKFIEDSWLECWIWRAGFSSDGRPMVRYQNKSVHAVKATWPLEHDGEQFPDRCIPVRTCTTEACVRPQHHQAAPVLHSIAPRKPVNWCKEHDRPMMQCLREDRPQLSKVLLDYLNLPCPNHFDHRAIDCIRVERNAILAAKS